MAEPAPRGLPEIPEADATGDIAALYADMRTTLRIPVVNLIWRHLATLPGALAWGWAVLRPAYASGAVDAAAQRLVSGLRLPPAVPLSPTALSAAEVPPEDVPVIRRILDTYHRANPLNLVALSALLAHLEGRSARGGALPVAAPPPPAADAPALPPLPPIVAEAALPAPTAALVWRLAELGVDGPVGELPSVWRHLAHWPGYLGLAWARLAPLAEEGWLAREMDGLREQRNAVAAGLPLAEAPAADALAPEVREAVAAVLRRFTDGLIVRMIPLIAVLREDLPGDPA